MVGALVGKQTDTKLDANFALLFSWENQAAYYLGQSIHRSGVTYAERNE
jgi:hypothetical protein